MEWLWVAAVLICPHGQDCHWIHHTWPAFATKEECQRFTGVNLAYSCVQYPIVTYPDLYRYPR